MNAITSSPHADRLPIGARVRNHTHGGESWVEGLVINHGPAPHDPHRDHYVVRVYRVSKGGSVPQPVAPPFITWVPVGAATLEVT